jgi:hypothetical protein
MRVVSEVVTEEALSGATSGPGACCLGRGTIQCPSPKTFSRNLPDDVLRRNGIRARAKIPIGDYKEIDGIGSVCSRFHNDPDAILNGRDQGAILGISVRKGNGIFSDDSFHKFSDSRSYEQGFRIRSRGWCKSVNKKGCQKEKSSQ